MLNFNKSSSLSGNALRSTNNCKTRIVPASATQAFLNEMFDLYSRFYEMGFQTFFEKIKKNDYYALYLSGDEIIGFTGLRMKEIQTQHGSYMSFYVGHSVMDPTFRGRSLITGTLCRVYVKHFLRKPFQPVYVWCDALTFKSYLSFIRSLPIHFPSRRQATPSKERAVINELGRVYYKDTFDPTDGTIHKDANVVSDPSAIISEDKLQVSDIRFFTQINPRYKERHGVLMIAPVTLKNFVFATLKSIKKRIDSMLEK